MDANYKHKITSNSDFTQEDFDLIQKVARQQFYKYLRNHPELVPIIDDDERNDYIEDIMIKIMEECVKKGEIIDVPLMHKIGGSKIIDIVRSKLRRPQDTSAISIDAYGDQDRADFLADPRNILQASEDKAVMIGLLDLYEKDSIEYKYVEYLLNQYGVIDTGIEGKPNSRQGDGYSDSHFGSMYGMKTGDSKWKSLKRRVMNDIKDYLTANGMNPMTEKGSENE